jgi:hypothetical protein
MSGSAESLGKDREDDVRCQADSVWERELSTAERGSTAFLNPLLTK